MQMGVPVLRSVIMYRAKPSGFPGFRYRSIPAEQRCCPSNPSRGFYPMPLFSLECIFRLLCLLNVLAKHTEYKTSLKIEKTI